MSIREREMPHLLMGTFEFDFRFAEGVVTDIWEISRRRTNLEDRDCFYSRSDFDQFRDYSDRKEDSRC